MDAEFSALKANRRKKFLGSLFSGEEQAISLIGEGLWVEGTLKFGPGVVRLDGRLQGKVIGRGTLIVGERGLLQGEMDVETLILCGRVEGRVAVSTHARITPTGRLFGKIQTSQLVIDEGGIFEGESNCIPPTLPSTGSSKNPRFSDR